MAETMNGELMVKGCQWDERCQRNLARRVRCVVGCLVGACCGLLDLTRTTSTAPRSKSGGSEGERQRQWTGTDGWRGGEGDGEDTMRARRCERGSERMYFIETRARPWEQQERNNMRMGEGPGVKGPADIRLAKAVPSSPEARGVSQRAAALPRKGPPAAEHPASRQSARRSHP